MNRKFLVKTHTEEMARRELTFEVTPSGCHEPTSHKANDGHGYPALYRNNKLIRIYRMKFEERNGPVPAGLVVRHTCDNRKCINPDHLIVGTRADNMYDRHTRGKSTNGELNGKSKIMEDDVLFILRSDLSNRHLSKQLGISESAVSHIRRGKRWKHLQSRIGKSLFIVRFKVEKDSSG